jgi:DNA polymerase delta subunit 1
MPWFTRPEPPPLEATVSFQIHDIEEIPFTHAGNSTDGNKPEGWGWLQNFDDIKDHLASYGIARIPKARQQVGVVLYGNTETGHSVALWVKYKRSFRVELDDSYDIGDVVEQARLASTTKSPINYTVEYKPRRYGWKSRPGDNRLPKLYTTLVISSSTIKRHNELVWAFKNQESEGYGYVVEIHEDIKKMPTKIKAIIETNVNYGVWVTVPVVHRDTRLMSSDYELYIDDPTKIEVDSEKIDIAPCSMASIDIECFSESRKFPSPEKENDVINLIGVVHRGQGGVEMRYLFRLARPGEKQRKRIVEPNGEEKLVGVYTEYILKTEKRLLMMLRAFIVVMDVRFAITFNGDGFDWKYILRRVEYHGIDTTMYTNIGQYLLGTWHDIKIGFGIDTEYLNPVEASAEKMAKVTFDVPGRVGCDIRHLMQKTMSGVPRYRFKRYSLNVVAGRLVGAQKLEMSAEEMFRIWDVGNDVELRRFCDYCIVDVQLLFSIIDKELIIDQVVAMANIQSTSFHGIVNTGQFKKVEYATMVNAAKLGIFTNNDFHIPEFDPKGAEVVTPICGPHGTPDKNVDIPTGEYLNLDAFPENIKEIIKDTLTEDQLVTYRNRKYVGTLDFASLYPSIMMSFIMCIFTIILPGREGDSRVERAHPKPKVSEEGLIIHEEIIYEDDDPTKAVMRRNRFVQNAKAPYTNGILPLWEADLKRKRTYYKRMMKEDPARRAIYDARQLAMKISMNSVYGVLKIICIYILESVTNRGRIMLNDVKKAVVALGHEIVYGDTDSVMVATYCDTPEEAWGFFKGLTKHLNSTLFSADGNMNVLEFEKVAVWFLLLGKKCYFMKKKEKLEHEYELSSTGTCDVRRDRPAILTDITIIMGKIMSMCNELPIQVSGLIVMEALRRHFEGIVSNTHSINKYAVTTTIQTINENTEKKAYMVLAKRLEERDGVSYTIGDSIDVVQVLPPKDHRDRPDAENVETPEDLEKDPKGKAKIDRHLYFEKKAKKQIIKMAQWYIPPKTLKTMMDEYDGALRGSLKGRNKTHVRSKSILEMYGGNEEGRRKRLFTKMYDKETADHTAELRAPKRRMVQTTMK